MKLREDGRDAEGGVPYGRAPGKCRFRGDLLGGVGLHTLFMVNVSVWL